ncbi:hypothetical protein BGW39_004020 [Mortierella sp. 14UC]|nr:hypothetical protein BGW39_004020 [Mortierella sp. 14UC]
MLYFATYEKLKQYARKAMISREELQHGSSTTGRGAIDYRTDQRPLDLGTYMVCAAGAVAIAATVCHTAEALRVHIKDRWTSIVPSSSVPFALSVKSSGATSPTSPTTSSSSPVFRTSGSLTTAKLLAPTLIYALKNDTGLV